MLEEVGFVGLGNMGGGMAKRLVAAGYQLVVYDIRPDAMAPLLALGAQAASSLADLAGRCDRVITMLVNSTIVEEVVLGRSGLIEGMRPGSILIDSSSSQPTSTRKIAEILAARGVEMLDAPVTGGSHGAAQGNLTIMVGGSEELYRECLPLFQAMGKKIFHVGPVGTGHTMKAINNMMLAINIQGACEALVLGVKAGLAPEKIVEVAGSGSGGSYALVTKGLRNILANDYSTPSLDLIAKDVDIATTLGRQLGVPLPAAGLVQQILITAQGRGMGNLDDACLVKLIEEAAGVKVAARP